MIRFLAVMIQLSRRAYQGARTGIFSIWSVRQPVLLAAMIQGLNGRTQDCGPVVGLKCACA